MQRSEIRKDFIVDKYVIIAPRRGQRPHAPTGASHVPHAQGGTCVFCPVQVDSVRDVYHIGAAKRSWKVKVIKNIFPAVTLDNPKAYGLQEVVIETPSHAQEIHELPVGHIELVFRAYAQRTRAIAAKEKIEYIMIFKNSGSGAGASIAHSHSQVFATNLIPPQLLHRSQKAQEHYLKTRRCIYCDMIAFEERSRRAIYKDRHISVFAPFASQSNYEVWMLPRRHIDNVTDLNVKERRAFATHLRKVLRKIALLNLPYNYYFHQVINDEDQHLYLKIHPRGSVWAGVEIGSGIIINPVPPEDAARFFRS